MAAQSHRTAVNLRVREDVKRMIDQAANAQGRSRSDFMIEAARRAAEETLLDQTLFRVDPRTFEAFERALDRGPDPDGAARLMSAPQPWRR